MLSPVTSSPEKIESFPGTAGSKKTQHHCNPYTAANKYGLERRGTATAGKRQNKESRRALVSARLNINHKPPHSRKCFHPTASIIFSKKGEIFPCKKMTDSVPWELNRGLKTTIHAYLRV
ncbi:MAG TPA: hypothetical protein P5219_10835 [Aminivibrio sp.]|nr:hypothetical protein [Aminivibrio sp.]